MLNTSAQYWFMNDNKLFFVNEREMKLRVIDCCDTQRSSQRESKPVYAICTILERIGRRILGCFTGPEIFFSTSSSAFAAQLFEIALAKCVLEFYFVILAFVGRLKVNNALAGRWEVLLHIKFHGKVFPLSCLSGNQYLPVKNASFTYVLQLFENHISEIGMKWNVIHKLK